MGTSHPCVAIGQDARSLASADIESNSRFPFPRANAVVIAILSVVEKSGIFFFQQQELNFEQKYVDIKKLKKAGMFCASPD